MDEMFESDNDETTTGDLIYYLIELAKDMNETIRDLERQGVMVTTDTGTDRIYLSMSFGAPR